MVNENNDTQADYSVALSIAGSDNSGGAGIQADLKTFTSMGSYGTSAVTCVVAEHPGRVSRIEPLSTESIREQIRLVFEAFPVNAMKTGMLYSEEIIAVIEATLEAVQSGTPLVIDPVMVATSGRTLLQPEAIGAMKRLLIPRATVVTPNRDEAELLSGQAIQDFAALRRVARQLSAEFSVPFLVKGGHLGGEIALDVLAVGSDLYEFEAPMVPNLCLHGTGCTFSAAITAGLARGYSLIEAVGRGKAFIGQAIDRRFRIGGYDLLNHLPMDFRP